MYLSATIQSQNLVIWSICIGVCLAICAYFISNNTLGTLLSKLLENKATAKENAKTLAELRLDKNVLVRLAVLYNKSLSGIVSLSEEATAEQGKQKGAKIDLATARFYINESGAQRSSFLISRRAKWYLLPIYIAVSLLVGYVASLAAPFVLSLFS